MDCPGCWEPIEGPGYDPGCSYGCGFTSLKAPECHDKFCSESCHENHCERASERGYERFHESGPIGPSKEQIAEWQRLK
jgi:hypothetical protein